MVERRENVRLPFEARESIRIKRERLWQNLQRDVAIELRVARAINLAHPAHTDNRQYFVRAEVGAAAESDECAAHYKASSRTGTKRMLRECRT